MSKHAKKEATANQAIKFLNNLAIEFNHGASRSESATKLLKALAKFVARQDADKQLAQGDLESVMAWVDTVKKLLVRALELEAANKDGTLGRSSAAKGNIDLAIDILNRLKDPVFANSRKKNPTTASPAP